MQDSGRFYLIIYPRALQEFIIALEIGKYLKIE